MSNIVELRPHKPTSPTTSKQTFEFIGPFQRRASDDGLLAEAVLLRENANRVIEFINEMRAASSVRRSPVICLADRKPLPGQFCGPHLPFGEIVELAKASSDFVLIDLILSGFHALQLVPMLHAMGAIEISAAEGQSFG